MGQPPRKLSVLAAIALLLLATGALIVAGRRSAQSRASPERLLLRARIAIDRGQFDLAASLVSTVARDDELWGRAQLIAGEAAAGAGRRADALRHFAALPRDGSPDAVLAALAQGELQRRMGRLSEAEREYTYVLQYDPRNALAHERMAFLLGATGRRWESRKHLLEIVRGGQATWEQLVLLGDLERPMDAGESLAQWTAEGADDDLVRLGLAAAAINSGRADEARLLLKEIIDRAPYLVAAQALLGSLLLDADDAAFLAWHRALLPEADAYPEVWVVRGLAARRRDNLPVAARCFWETLRLAPMHRRANYHLGQVLVALGETGGEELAEHSTRLFDLSQALDDVVRSKGADEAPIKRVVELLEATGRPLEACAWSVVAVQTFPEAGWPDRLFARLSPLLGPESPQVIPSANLALRHDLSRFPGHEQLIEQIGRGSQRVSAAKPKTSIRFEQAQDAGLDCVYFNGHDPSRKGARMFEQTGGGVAVLDFDGDDRPDLFFTQGTKWPIGAPQPSPPGTLTDRLYRNRQGRSFEDVTRAAGLIDGGFGQGCAAGDFDNDGFPDLYVGHIGRNQLLWNKGDGTFSDVTDAAGIRGNDWTASCIIVDLNADGCPDLFDVTYVCGPHVYEAVCNGHACSPKKFEGIPDRLWLSRGDGTFKLIPNATPASNSKGLGVVAFDLFERGRPCLFIANDQVPGFFLRNYASQGPPGIRLEDQGFASGLAFNEDGLAMAGMGIAAEDVNGDGRIDFYLTTFKDESKILFLQEAAGLFVDATNPAGLRAAGLPFVGWGAQFLDADRDGEPDLVVANGHVDDYRDQNGTYKMRAQFFRNTGAGRFAELGARDIGEFFGREYLGRGLARLDWNGDGRMEFIVSNIGDSPSLLTNTTNGPGHFLNVRLHATATARDAIGTVVEVTAGTRRWSKQLVAGDGYMASNERLLQFGLGTADSVNELRVNWPSGATMLFADLPADATIELVEGARWGTLRRDDRAERAAAVP